MPHFSTNYKQERTHKLSRIKISMTNTALNVLYYSFQDCIFKQNV